ncbi:ATP-binding protein [Capillimicrobium parvum]|uniref:ATP-binding protein n=1 Tax=Capillimicrobium parvum TaxID=2884022 RepID=UPI00216B4343|nr:ATP-binding protein [Capillimicrobium parvum]
MSNRLPDPFARLEERPLSVPKGEANGATDLIAATFRDAPVPALLVEVGAPEGVVCRAPNRAFCRLVGFGEEEVWGQPLDELIEDASRLVTALEGGSAEERFEGHCRHGRGGRIRVVVEAAPLDLPGQERLAILQLHEMTEAEDAQRALRESENRMQEVVDNVTALIYIKRRDGRYLLINRHFEEMFGVSREDTPNCSDYDFFPPAIAAVYAANDRRVLTTGKPMECEEPWTHGRTWLSLKFPLFDDEGAPYAVGGISTDITDRSRAEAAIRHAKEEAERGNRAKSEFLSRMSHELRTPLNAIIGFGQLLEMEDLPPSANESVERIVTAGRHLLTLINEVLDISRIEAGAQPTAVEPVHACEPLAEALDLITPLARERKVSIVRDFHGGLFEFVLADPHRLKQVLLNVVTNAVKYNRPGGTVRAAFVKSGDDRLRFVIMDTGLGIEPENLEKVFLPFERLGADRTNREGTGLGLALSRGLVEAMGGTIGIERSAPGEGTTFFVELPLTERRDLAATDLLRGSSADVEGLTIGGPVTVAYIEDNLSNLELVERLFERVGNVTLIPAMQGQLGIELAARHRPHLVLLDLHLPDLDGDEVLRRLQGDERTKHIPVIVLSADATSARIDELKEHGAAGYLTKPIDVHEFLAAVRQTLARTA